MEHVAELVAHNLEQHGQADGLHGSGCRTGAGTDHHGDAQHQPGAGRPQHVVGRSESCRGLCRGNLEGCKTEALLQSHRCVYQQDDGDEQCEHRVAPDVPAELRVLQQADGLPLQDGNIEQGEVHARDEHEEGCDVLDVGRVVCHEAALLHRVTAGGGSRHGGAQAVEPGHVAQQQQGSVCKGDDEVDGPYPFRRHVEAGMELAVCRTGGLGSKELHAA